MAGEGIAPDRVDEVRHDGEYVLTKDGCKDFGEISETIAKEIRRQKGKIRLRIGEHNDNTKKGYGEIHIERSDRLDQLQQNGFHNARDFIADVTANYDAILEGKNGALFLAKQERLTRLVVVKLEPSQPDDFYDVKTAYVTSFNKLKKKKPLWTNPNGFVPEVAGRRPTDQSPTSAISGLPACIISPKINKKSSSPANNANVPSAKTRHL